MAPAAVESAANPPAPAAHPAWPPSPPRGGDGDRGGDAEGTVPGATLVHCSGSRPCGGVVPSVPAGAACHLISPMTLPTAAEKLMPPNRTPASDKQKT